MPQLTREQKLEYLALRQEQDRRRALADPVYFIQNHGWIRHVDGDAGSRFRLWDAQKKALKLIDDNDDTIFLKARRLGLTWLALNYAYWMMLTNDGCHVGFVAQGLEETKSSVERLRWIHNKISEHSSHIIKNHDLSGTDNVQSLQIGKSLFTAKPSTGAAFRGGAYKLIIMDEMAFCRNADKLIAAIKPATEGGGKSIYISTGNGEEGDGKTFNQEWGRAVSGESPRKPFFIPWQARPDRDQQWKKTELAEMGEARFRAEYPETPDDAFSSNMEGLVYDRQQLTDAEKVGIYNPSTPLIVGIDWGTSTHFVYIQLVGASDIRATAASYHIAAELAIYQADQANISISDIVTNNNTKTLKLSSGSIGYNYDAAGKQQAITFAAATNQKLEPVPFSKYKNLTIGFIKYLLAEGRLTINTRECPVLYRQLKNLRYNERDTEKIDKTDDHGADALIAALAPAAARWLKELKSVNLS